MREVHSLDITEVAGEKRYLHGQAAQKNCPSKMGASKGFTYVTNGNTGKPL